MYHIFLSFVAILICYKFGDWKNWKIYYPTILFFILNSVICVLLTYNHQLWCYESGFLKCTLCDLLICITVYPSTVMVFIPYLPKKKTKIFNYISIYVAMYTIAEFIGYKLKYFKIGRAHV